MRMGEAPKLKKENVQGGGEEKLKPLRKWPKKKRIYWGYKAQRIITINSHSQVPKRKEKWENMRAVGVGTLCLVGVRRNAPRQSWSLPVLC